MYELHDALTRAINGQVGQYPAADVLMVWISTIGVSLLVLAVAIQWWPRANKPHTRHVFVAGIL